MERIRELDEWLLTRVFEPIAWWVEYHTGYSNFQIAQLCLLGCAIGVFIALRAERVQANSLMWWVICVSGFLSLVSFFFIFEVLNRVVSSSKSANPLRLNWRRRLPRLPMETAFVVISTLLEMGGLAIFVACLWPTDFFAACNSMPPSYKEKKDEAARWKHLKTA